ncbi:Glycosyltransferase, GT2 family [Jatrophihabitans endophyticus]|uniref:Glycosyltransferase, GT2 family n=1 Tax=Jatrophihabitans endophyticus TaxID=1206085 RepID=A0A1M5Q5U4_9ACTN|nr:glycosyltransferase [Jatrophihabitans endophyticus]SHH09240.1 Glycosyltransferase, GT2 family [Jatrophihabitans endophyticus]
MTDVVHLVVGPAEHGVVRHARLVAAACGQRTLHVASIDELPARPDADVVHLAWTDRLLGPALDVSGAAFERVAAWVAAAGASLSVTLHDVPHDDSDLQRRRRVLYARVIAAARGVVVNSRTELALVEGLPPGSLDAVHSLRAVPLPLEPAHPAEPGGSPLPPASVTVLGFVFPDRGYDEVVAALPPGSTLAAVGRASDGHDDLVARYAAQAGERWLLTGYVPDDALAAYLADAAVPVAPNRRVTASASINTWLAHGRRPLVPACAYTRELAAERPGAVELYDPDDPDALAAAVRAALADPGRTRLAPGTPRGPAVADVAAGYREHLAACAPPAVRHADGRPVVPGNRWDLLASEPADPPSVSVVIPYYDAQRELDLVLTGLAAQDHRGALEVVVVDDGSPRPPDVTAAAGVPVRVLHQDDQGFRAAAARDLGARAARHDVLVFLDGDTVPEPGFVRELTRLPARCPDVLAVGRRRHADLAGLPASALADWWHGRVSPPELTEPAWLRDAYRDTADLLHADRRSYRFVISAVLSMSAELYRRAGGFDPRFVGYGGEDWELAHRARNAGAVLAHVPAAVAWHDGPDWADRGDTDTRTAGKDRETLTLAALLPDPESRGPGPWLPYPSVVVRAGCVGDVDALATVRSARAAGADCSFWFAAIDGPGAEHVLAGPGVQLGDPPADVLARAWCHAELTAPADLADLMTLAALAERHGRVDTPALRLRSARSLARARGDDALAALLFGRHERTAPAPRPGRDLAGRLRPAVAPGGQP